MNLKRLLRQTAVYWGSPAPDGYGGNTYAAPREISCRWEASNERFRTKEGEEFVAAAEVWVDETLEDGGLLYLGTLDDLDSATEADPQTLIAARPIRLREDVPTMKGAAGERRVIL